MNAVDIDEQRNNTTEHKGTCRKPSPPRHQPGGGKGDGEATKNLKTPDSKNRKKKLKAVLVGYEILEILARSLDGR